MPDEEMLIPDGWVEGEKMPPPDVPAVKQKWYTLTMGPIPEEKKPYYIVVD